MRFIATEKKHDVSGVFFMTALACVRIAYSNTIVRFS